MGAAQQTAQGNIDTAKAAAEANRVNQVTPYGNLQYSQGSDGSFDQGGYDTAMQAYNQDLQKYSLDYKKGGTHLLSKPSAPTRQQFTHDPTWTATQTLSPAEQAQLDSNQKLQLQLSGLAQKGADSADALLSNPNVDYSGLPTPISGQSAQDEIMKRLNPQLDRQREALRTQLLNQGIGMGNQAYQGAFNDQNTRENDLLSAAAIQGIGIDQQARQQGIQERAYAQDRPLNLINALRTGSQVQNPNFINVGQQGQTAGPDYAGATNALSGYNTDLFNQQQATNNANTGAAAGVAGSALAAYGTYAAAVA